MSDRTQTLSVELTREEMLALAVRVGALSIAEREELEPPIGGGPMIGYSAAIKFAAQLRNALSQPERQGGEASLKDRLQNEEIWCEIHRDRVKALEALLTVCPVCENDFSGGGVDEPSTDCSNCNNLGYVVPAQPPAPVLSDQEKERLLDIATGLSLSSFASDDWWVHAAAFLRGLASREHRGEDCDHDFKRIEDSEHVTGNGYAVCRRCGVLQAPGESTGDAPISVELTRDEAEHLLLKAGLDGGFHSSCDKLRTALTGPQSQPPAGEEGDA